MRIAITAVIFCVLGAACRAEGACGEKITLAGGNQITIPSIISWDASVEEATQVSKIKKKPFAIYFSCKDDCRIVGESSEAIKEYVKANNNSLPATVVDVPKYIDAVREMGVGNFVKVPLTKENKALADKYGAESNTIVLVDSSGEKIALFKCTPDVAKVAEAARKEVAAWHAKLQETATK